MLSLQNFRAMKVSLCILIGLFIYLATSAVSAINLDIGEMGSGNNIYTGTSAAAIFLTEVAVPVDNFTLVAFSMRLDTRSGNNQDLRLQVFRPTTIGSKQFMLIGQVFIEPLINFQGTYSRTLNSSEYVKMMSGDRLAIFSNGPYVPIPYSLPGNTVPYVFGSNPPSLNSMVDFSGLPYPLKFTLQATLSNDTLENPTTAAVLSREGATLGYSAEQVSYKTLETLKSTQTPTSTEALQFTTPLVTSQDTTDGANAAALPWCVEPTMSQTRTNLCNTSAHGCSQQCVDVPESYYCTCIDGYLLDPRDNTSCLDVSECEEDNGFCQHYCSNLIGGYECSCRNGYYLSEDIHSCIDTDECEENVTCKSSEICVNTPGSFVCLPTTEGCPDINIGASALGSSWFLSEPVFIGYIVWLFLLTAIVILLLLACCRHRGRGIRSYHADRPLCYDGPYNPKEEERADRERIARLIHSKYPGVSDLGVCIGKPLQDGHIYESNDARSIFLTDMEVSLSGYSIHSFHVYINTKTGPVQDFKAQVYRPLQPTKHSYILVGEATITPGDNYRGELLVQVNETIPVSSGDRLAIMNTNSYVPLPFALSGQVSPHAYIHPPAVGEQITISSLNYPISFPIKACLKPDPTIPASTETLTTEGVSFNVSDTKSSSASYTQETSIHTTPSTTTVGAVGQNSATVQTSSLKNHLFTSTTLTQLATNSPSLVISTSAPQSSPFETSETETTSTNIVSEAPSTIASETTTSSPNVTTKASFSSVASEAASIPVVSEAPSINDASQAPLSTVASEAPPTIHKEHSTVGNTRISTILSSLGFTPTGREMYFSLFRDETFSTTVSQTTFSSVPSDGLNSNTLHIGPTTISTTRSNSLEITMTGKQSKSDIHSSTSPTNNQKVTATSTVQPTKPQDLCRPKPQRETCSHINGVCEHLCEDTENGPVCLCYQGYMLSNPNETRCNDVDECLFENGKCEHTCKNTRGSYHCDCPQGFYLNNDRRSCLDEDECTSNKATCQSEETCINVPGSFICARKSVLTCVLDNSPGARTGSLVSHSTVMGFIIWLVLLSVLVIVACLSICVKNACGDADKPYPASYPYRTTSHYINEAYCPQETASQLQRRPYPPPVVERLL